MTLGETIGIVRHSFTNTNDAKEEALQLTINIDFRGSSDIEIKNWLCSNRVVAFARPLSKLTRDEMDELQGDTIAASSIGQKVKSREESIAILMTAGLPREIAELAVDNPEAMAKAEIKVPEDTEYED